MSPSPDTADRLTRIHQAVAAREQEFLHLLAQLVGIDSGSIDHAGVRRITDVIEGLMTAADLVVERVPAGDLEILIGRRAGTGPTILLNAHMDTVFDVGAAAERPFSIDDGGMAHGPGVADDKCGIVAALIATQALGDVGADPELMIVLTPDEELGSPGSAAMVAKLAGQADVALCLEAARADGSIVSARKGGANMTVTITGRAAHSGVEPEKGVHAALQMAHAIISLQALNDPAAGITVNAGVAHAGTRANIVPAEAQLWLDLRAWTGEDFERVLTAAESVVREPHVAGVSVDTVRDAEAPPMEATPGTIALADSAIEIAGALGFDLRHVATGGIGDANVIASAGIPVLDGLAPVGGDDHTPTEWLDTASIVPRVALLAGLIDRIATNGVPTP